MSWYQLTVGAILAMCLGAFTGPVAKAFVDSFQVGPIAGWGAFIAATITGGMLAAKFCRWVLS